MPGIPGPFNELSRYADDLVRIRLSGAELPSLALGNLSDLEARLWYLEQETKIPDLISGYATMEEKARAAFDFRNQIRTQARDAMSNRNVAEQLFGTKPNMTWEQIIEKYSSQGLSGDALYQEIIKASQRSNSLVNQQFGIYR